LGCEDVVTLVDDQIAGNGGARAGGLRGRPRRADIDEAVLQATEDLLAERGLAGATVTTIAARSGVARGSIYLRWPNRGALIAAAARRAMGEPMRFSGDLERDVREGIEYARSVLLRLSEDNVLPALLAGWSERRAGERLPFDAMIPGRATLAEEYRTRASGADMRSDVDADVVFDLMIGGLLARLLATGAPPSTEDSTQLVDAILNGVRIRADAGS
jgi:AcrR family transcriptional regulator